MSNFIHCCGIPNALACLQSSSVRDFPKWTPVGVFTRVDCSDRRVSQEKVLISQPATTLDICNSTAVPGLSQGAGNQTLSFGTLLTAEPSNPPAPPNISKVCFLVVKERVTSGAHQQPLFIPMDQAVRVMTKAVRC